jgi:glucan phosphoethanolaminetransferase (alkaline phosphatase superfamily)
VFLGRFPNIVSTVLVFLGPTSFASGLLKGAYTLLASSTTLLFSSFVPIAWKLLLFSVLGTSAPAKDKTSCYKVLVEGSFGT